MSFLWGGAKENVDSDALKEKLYSEEGKNEQLLVGRHTSPIRVIGCKSACIEHVVTLTAL